MGDSGRSVAIDPNSPETVYYGSRDWGAYKSMDGGVTWTRLIGLFSEVQCLVIDPAVPSTVYAGTGAGVYKSLDGGGTWVLTGLAEVTLALAIDSSSPQTLYAGTSWSPDAPNSAVFRTLDGGNNWTKITVGLPTAQVNVRSLAIDPVNPQTVFAGTWRFSNTERPTGLFKTTNSGVEWAPTRLSSLVVGDLEVAGEPTEALYVSGWSNLVFKTYDTGNTWSGGLIHHDGSRVDQLAADPVTPTTVYAGSWWGLFKTTDGGSSWVLSDQGLPKNTTDGTSDVRAVVVDPLTPSTVYVGCQSEDAGVYRSIDGGATWSPSGLAGHGVLAMAVDPQQPDLLFAGTTGYGVFRSTDGGATWTTPNSGIPLVNCFVHTLAVDPVNTSTVYAGTWHRGLFKSTDGGANWQTINSGLTKSCVSEIAVDPVVPSNVFVATCHGGVFRSVDGGVNWFEMNEGLSTLEIDSLLVDPASPNTVFAGLFQGGVFRYDVALGIMTASPLPAGMQGASYSQTLTAAGGTEPYTWSVTAGSLPPGLSLDASTGEISGTPTVAGSYHFTVTVTDADSDTASKAFDLLIAEPLEITTGSPLPDGKRGWAYSQTLTATGGVLPYSWAITAGSLPAGVSLDAGTGVISGTPTDAGDFNFTVEVTDANAMTASKGFALHVVDAPMVTTGGLPYGAVGIAYAKTLTAIGGVTPYTWTISAGSLPDGLTLGSTTGVISGTPTTDGDFSFTVQVTDAAALTGVKTFNLTIVAEVAPVNLPVFAAADYDGDWEADIAVYRGSNGYWYIRNVGFFQWGGQPGDVPVPGDYNGDWKADLAVYRPATGDWVIRNVGTFRWGIQAGDVPVPGDYDGDGYDDIAIYRPSNGYWYIRGVGNFRWGIQPGDVPVPADYDGDGTTDIAVFRPSNGYWYIRNVGYYRWGVNPGDVPVPGDYDGDGTADVAIYRPFNGHWYIRNIGTFKWGIQPGDVPVQADYDGDGKFDLGVFRPSSGYWYILDVGNLRWGIQPDDMPVTRGNR